MIIDCRNCASTHKINEYLVFGKNCKVSQETKSFSKVMQVEKPEKIYSEEIKNVDTITKDKEFLIASIDGDKLDCRLV